MFVPPYTYLHFPSHKSHFCTVSCFLCLTAISPLTTSSTLHPPLSPLSILHNFSLSLLLSFLLSRQFDLHFISPTHTLLRYLPCSPQAITSAHSYCIQRRMIDVPVTFHFTIHHHLLYKICGWICMNASLSFWITDWIHISAADSLLLWGSVEAPLYLLPSSVPEV